MDSQHRWQQPWQRPWTRPWQGPWRQVQRRSPWRRPAILTVAAIALLTLLGLAGTTPAEAHGALPATTSSPSGHVTIIVLDMSGSMSGNDPQGLRCSAANAYIDLSGPGSFIGVVGLDNSSGARGGPHNFETADWTIDSQEMATVNARQGLRSAIASKSNNCRPDASTPTYDALVKAETMLANATKGKQLTGSVILLTDGTPDPDTTDQINAIKQELVPQFKANNWPIDTIALGRDSGGFHSFLSDVASATSGSFYDDGHGMIAGVSPLNITPFFLDIFKVRNGRSPGPDIAPTQLDGGTTARNFSVGQYVTHLDVVVVKDNRTTSVSIAAPDGQRFPPAAAGTFVSTDPYYAIFSIDNPQQGPWELDVSGNGLFLMDSLKTSALALGVSAPAAGAVLALGQPFTLTATLSENGTPVSGGRFSLDAHLAYAGGDQTAAAQDAVLSDPNGSGQYSAMVTLPTSAPAGSYRLTVTAHAASDDVRTAEQVVRFELFPSAVLLAPDTGKPVTGTVNAQALSFDPVLRVLYAIPPISWISGWPLDGHPATPSARVQGQVYLLDKPYTAASVSGTAQKAGSASSVPATVGDDGNGRFHVYFPAASAGTYSLSLSTSGTYALTHGDLTTVTRTVQVVVTPATSAEELRAWIITLVYLLLLALIVLLARYALSPKPYGTLASSEGGGEEFTRARRGPIAALLAPSAVTSAQMGMDPGLRFRFFRGGRITVQAAGRADGYTLHGEPVPRMPVSAGEAQLSSADGSISYHVSGARVDAEEREDAEWGESQPARGLGSLGGIGGARRRAASDFDDFDDYGGSGGKRGLGLPFGRGKARDADADRADPWGDDEPKLKRSGDSRGSRGGRGKRSSEWDDNW